jgi:hypothetical protein
MTKFGLLDKLEVAGGYQVQNFTLQRYQDGTISAEKVIGDRMMKEYGGQWR